MIRANYHSAMEITCSVVERLPLGFGLDGVVRDLGDAAFAQRCSLAAF